MIDDEIPWRDELVKIANRLEAKTRQSRWTDRTDCLIERDFVLGAYTIRKLIESDNVDDEIKQQQFPVKRYELVGTPPELRFPVDVGNSYDFENGRRRTLSVLDLCDEIVHNCLFTFYCGESKDLYDGVLVSSDRQGLKHLYLVLASDYIALCCDVGGDDQEP